MTDRVLFNDEHVFVPINDPDAARRPWIEHIASPPTIAAQQLRLFAAELAFLCTVPDLTDNLENHVLIYAGAAPGGHIPYLAALFPKVRFYCYDPEPVSFAATEQITVIRAPFTERLAHYWREKAGDKIIFISDIRTPVWAGREYEGEVEFMNLQADIMSVMLPKYYSVRFRIPYAIINAGEPFPYFNGHLMFQPFGNSLTMELHLVGRLGNVIAGRDAFNYPSRVLEELMFYHNTEVRPQTRLHANTYTMDDKPFSGPHAAFFDNSYDCTYLMYIVDLYMRRTDAIVRFTSETDSLDFIVTIAKQMVTRRSIAVGTQLVRAMRPPGAAVVFDFVPRELQAPAAAVFYGAVSPPEPDVISAQQAVAPPKPRVVHSAPTKKKASTPPAPVPQVKVSTEFQAVVNRRHKNRVQSK